MKRLSHAVAIVLLLALVSSCASGSGTTGPGPGTAGQVAQVPGGGGAGPGASPTGAVPQAVVDEHWPREATSGSDHVTVYQPQVDSWDGSLLRAHAAVAVKTGDAKAAPTFGVVWVTVRTEVDRGTRLVTLRDGLVTRADFPSSPGKQDAYARTIEQAVLHETVIGLDRLEAALGIHQEAQKGEAMPPRNSPPVIVFSTVPAILVSIDGPPAYRPVSGTRLERVINTHPLLLRAPAGTHYLHVFDGWMEAPALQGPWTAARATIPDLATALEAARKSGSVDLLEGGDPKDPKTRPSLAKGPVPGIHVATTPTELIVTEGEPDYAPIRGTQLLYVKNTTGNVFRDLQDQMIYVLVSGRWFRSTGMGGPWAYVPGRELPADFAWIPDDSPKENVKASVPGTLQAREAHIANSIPQTATVKRSEAKLTGPVIDGAPKMTPIAGTPLQYVVNSATPIIVVDPHSYYALQNGVWFVGTSVAGPWVVATSVPAVIYSIPPSSPVHYVTYVRVYDWTSQVVYVGYTPGYYGTYVASDGVVVYGTGYYYTPWIGTVWYGPPVTYGVAAAVTYTPWTGWAVGFGFGWAWGASTGAWAWGAYPWWGPMYGAAWGPYGAATWGPGGWAATTGNVYHHWGSATAVTRSSAGFNAWTGNEWANHVGASYNSRTGTLAAGQRAGVGNVYTGNYAYGSRGAAVDTRTGAAASGSRVTVGNAYTGQSASASRAQVYNPRTGQTSTWNAGHSGNDLYASHDGHVYQRDVSGDWQQHSWGSDGGWSHLGDSGASRSLDDDWASRFNGSERMSAFRSNFGEMGGRFGGFRRR